MNNVDYLLRVQFSTLPQEEKLEIKRLGPHRPDDFILNQPGEKTNRNFKMEWFERKTWLTASTTKKKVEIPLTQTKFGPLMTLET